MSLSEISNYLKYDPTSSTFLRWTKAKSKNLTVGDEAGFLRRNNFHIIYDRTEYKSAQIVFYLHHGEIPEKIKYLDGNRRNLSIDNLIPVDKKPKKERKKSESVNNEMKQPDILENTTYSWKLQKDMILILDENNIVVRKFKNPFKQDEDFVTNIRIEIVLRFGINPKNLKEKE